MTTLPSNEAIIEDLTKDLADTDIHCDTDSKASKDSPLFETSSTANIGGNFDSEPKPSDSGGPNDDDDTIDDASLLDRDMLLSDEEKENLRVKALEHKNEGNTQFRQGEFSESVISYSEALRICPMDFPNDRSIFYANRAASKHKLKRNESALQDCTKAIELNSSYVKAYLRRAVLYEESDKLDEALEDYKKVLEFDPKNQEAISASMRLPQQINERNEKMKTEMLDKLKDLGNMVLRPFGLSTNNFKMTQDPNSGGYSINFVQNQ